MPRKRTNAPDVTEAFLQAYRQEYESGNSYALLRAVTTCARAGVAIPEWAAEAFLHATNRWFRMETRTLDEALGVEWPKGKHFERARRNGNLAYAVSHRCKELINAGRAIDNSMFGEVGAEFGIGKTLAQRFYYSTNPTKN